MANVKITDLAAYTNPASTDVLPIVDVGADGGAGVTKKVSIADLLKNAGSGTAADPGIAFDGDSDTGIYRPGADQLALVTNGAGRLFVASDGKVGIGNTSPATFLDVDGRITTNGITPGLSLKEIDGLADNSNWALRADNGFFNIQAIDDTGFGGGELWRFTRDGDAVQAFEGLNGSNRITLSNIDSKITFSNVLGTIGTATNHDLQIVTNNSDAVRIDTSGRLLVGTTSQSGGSLFQVSDDRIRVASSKTPASASDTGTSGEICWDSNYIYVAVGTNTWKRAALSTW